VRRRAPGRVTRQILSGAQLTPPRDTLGGHGASGSSFSFAFRYLVVLAALVIASALVWVIWGIGPASIILLILALGLIASWLVL
jgi:hypothetical protein